MGKTMEGIDTILDVNYILMEKAFGAMLQIVTSRETPAFYGEEKPLGDGPFVMATALFHAIRRDLNMENISENAELLEAIINDYEKAKKLAREKAQKDAEESAKGESTERIIESAS